MITELSPFVGINKDLPAHEVATGVVTDALNVRFREGSAELFTGQTEVYQPAPLAPLSTFSTRIGTDRYWLALGQTKAYCVTGSPPVWTDITRASSDYAASLDTLWNGGVLNGVPILNNGVDVPQVWAPVSTAQKLTALPAWPANTLVRVLRPWRNYMFGFDVKQGGNRFPHRVMWSHSADPGTVPDSWDISDTTKDAGEFDLAGVGHVIDALPLRDALIVYKENSTYSAKFVGAPFMFQFQEVFSSSGMLSPDCAVEIDGSHVVLTSNDLIRHDGTQMQSVIDKVTRRWLFKNIDSAMYNRCFLTKNVYFNEVWVCFPELGATRCTKALVYNYKDGSISIRELPGITGAGTGLVDEGADQTFDSASGSFDSDVSPFNQSEFGAQLTRTVLCAPDRPALVLVDSTPQYFAENVQAFAERRDITLDVPNQIKTVRRLRPRVTAPAGTVLNFKMGAQMTQDGEMEWSDAIPFVVDEDVSVDAFVAGRYLAWRVESNTSNAWRLDGLDMEVTANGGY